MNLRTFLLLDAFLIAFGYTLYVIATVGYAEFFRLTLANPAVIQVHIDLVLALVVALVWMRGDARERELPFAPYLLATLCLGTTGLLGYLLHRELRASRAVPARGVATA